MRKPVSSTKRVVAPSASRSASPWAVILLLVSSGFAVGAAVLLAMGYVPV